MPIRMRMPKDPTPYATSSAKIRAAQVRIGYSRPSVKGGSVWSDMAPAGQVWHTGANAVTTFETDKTVLVEGKELLAGKYAFFTIPGQTKWTLIFNSEPDQWGSANYKLEKDVLRVEVVPKKSPQFYESLTFVVGQQGEVDFFWENVQIKFTVVPQ